MAINVEIKFTYLNIGLSLSFLCSLGAIRAVSSEFFVWRKNSLKTARPAPKLHGKDKDNLILR